MMLLAGCRRDPARQCRDRRRPRRPRPNSWLRRAALVLVLCVLPLAIIAALSLGQRIGQYGWTPERIWGVVAVGDCARLWRRRLVGGRSRAAQDFDDPLRPLQTKLAIGLCGLALFLALPILDFGAISARSQLARLESGKVKAEEFDWTRDGVRFRPGWPQPISPKSRSAAPPASVSSGVALHRRAKIDTHLSQETESVAQQARLDQYLRVLSPDITVTDELKARNHRL